MAAVWDVAISELKWFGLPAERWRTGSVFPDQPILVDPTERHRLAGTFRLD